MIQFSGDKGIIPQDYSRPPENRQFRSVMDGDRVIEVTNAGRLAWIARNEPRGEDERYERDSITFELSKAQVYTDWTRARDTVSRLSIGYPQWECREVRYTENYRVEHAIELLDQPSSPPPSESDFERYQPGRRAMFIDEHQCEIIGEITRRIVHKDRIELLIKLDSGGWYTAFIRRSPES